ncbi:ABC transporter ATP-binding protein [Ornithinibacillus gellani]|uniref:ABC transporter ATP-binding protein n=1 Tax=Ornithinibacillus gellani TaxID=2293253 RepID=UPI000F471698|nr:ABC transporter ATP-binding protein [Ornithinibacillus gellani]TQS71057.1 ABC transporter ATP-binding protein [Ornithinibacillus gellani]
MQETKKHGWKEFFQLVLKAKLPWHLYILALIGLFASTTFTLGLPVVMSEIFAGNIFDFEIVSKYFVLMIASLSLAAISAFLIYITNPIVMRNIQWIIWPKLIRMPMRKYEKQPSLQLISRITVDPGFIDRAVADLNNVLNSTYGLVGSFIIMYGMSSKLTLALLPIIPYILIVSAITGHFTQKTQYGVQHAFSGLTAFFAERLPKIRLVKSFGKEDKEIDRGKTIIQDQYQADKKRALVDLFAQPLLNSIQGIIIGIVLVYGSYLVSKGEMKVSQVIAFYMYVQYLHMSVTQYGRFWQTLKQAKGASEKIAQILDSKDEVLKRDKSLDDAKQQTSGDIVLENVSFSYADTKVLSNLNFTIPKGKVTAIIGPSGGGKSTIFSLIERLYDPNVGRVLMGNMPAEKINLDEWRHGMAYVSQSTPLISGTIRENITYGLDREVADEELVHVAKMAAALEFIQEFPDGFDTEVGEFGSKLSGGQRQRIAIARAFIMDSQYLLLDEATSNLDAQSEYLIERALQKLMKNRTTIMISHDLKDVKNADQIIVIDQGEVNGIGTHQELSESNELYQHLTKLQSEKDAKLLPVF